MKICVVGLGAIGGLFAGWLGSRLAPGEVHLSALARGATLSALHHQGLRLQGGPGAGEPLHVLLHAYARETGCFLAFMAPSDVVVFDSNLALDGGWGAWD